MIMELVGATVTDQHWEAHLDVIDGPEGYEHACVVSRAGAAGVLVAVHGHGRRHWYTHTGQATLPDPVATILDAAAECAAMIIIANSGVGGLE